MSSKLGSTANMRCAPPSSANPCVTKRSPSCAWAVSNAAGGARTTRARSSKRRVTASRSCAWLGTMMTACAASPSCERLFVLAQNQRAERGLLEPRLLEERDDGANDHAQRHRLSWASVDGFFLPCRVVRGQVAE